MSGRQQDAAVLKLDAATDTPAETVVGALKNVFAFFVAKLGARDRDRKDIHRSPAPQRRQTSPCGEEGPSRTHMPICRKLPGVRKNGASLTYKQFDVDDGRYLSTLLGDDS